MIPELGHFALALACALAFAQAVLPLWGAHRGDARLIASAPALAAGQFIALAASFGALSLWGYTTNRDLSAWGSFLFMGLIGIIIAAVWQMSGYTMALYLAGLRGIDEDMHDVGELTPAVAALLNGALGHSLDFDDTHADSSLHPSAPVVPAAFAVGEMVGASGRDVLTAIVAGSMAPIIATSSTMPASWK